MKIIVPTLLIFGGLAALISIAVIQGGIPELHVRALHAQQQSYSDQVIKVKGRIKKIHRDSRPLEFEMEDMENPNQVVYAVVDATRPDTFDVDRDCSVTGKFDPETGKIFATSITTQCPSKYEGSDSLKQGSSKGYSKEEPVSAPQSTPTPSGEPKST